MSKKTKHIILAIAVLTLITSLWQLFGKPAFEARRTRETQERMRDLYYSRLIDDATQNLSKAGAL